MADTTTPATEANEEEDSKTISFTLSSVFIQALDVKGEPYKMKGQAWLKQQIMASAFGADIVLRLKDAIDTVIARNASAAPQLVEQNLNLGN